MMNIGDIMDINWTEFTPLASLAGGVLIGLSALMLWLLQGRIMGVSGILGQWIKGEGSGQHYWRAFFILGVIIAPVGYVTSIGGFDSQMVTSPPGLGIAGLLVGFGTAIGAGCTSGHGICGLSRISVRSLVATCCFVGSGMLTVLVLKMGIFG